MLVRQARQVRHSVTEIVGTFVSFMYIFTCILGISDGRSTVESTLAEHWSIIMMTKCIWLELFVVMDK